jgi:sugar phosphate isomerase/epimerase
MSCLIKSRQRILGCHRVPGEKSLYRIFTEENEVDQFKAALRSLGIDFTVFSGHGTWHGQEESSIVIELANISRARAEYAARLIKSLNKQEAVLLQEIPVFSQLI